MPTASFGGKAGVTRDARFLRTSALCPPCSGHGSSTRSTCRLVSSRHPGQFPGPLHHRRQGRANGAERPATERGDTTAPAKRRRHADRAPVRPQQWHAARHGDDGRTVDPHRRRRVGLAATSLHRRGPEAQVSPLQPAARSGVCRKRQGVVRTTGPRQPADPRRGRMPRVDGVLLRHVLDDCGIAANAVYVAYWVPTHTCRERMRCTHFPGRADFKSAATGRPDRLGHERPGRCIP